MEEIYFVIHNGDGDTTVRTYTKEQLLKEINEDEMGGEGILTELPDDSDTNYWGGYALIIKGRIVTPVAEKVVTKFKID